MSRRAASITQADVARTIRAAKQAGAATVEVVKDGEMTEVINLNGWFDAGHIYFIEGGDLIKIGFSRTPEDRIAQLQYYCPVPLTILHVEPGTFENERAFHHKFSSIRAHGEWFRKTPELLAFIESRKK